MLFLFSTSFLVSTLLDKSNLVLANTKQRLHCLAKFPPTKLLNY